MSGFTDNAGSEKVNNTAVAGYASVGSAAAATTGGADYTFTWSQMVSHVFIQNNTTANAQFELDVATSAGSPFIAPGQTMLLDVACTVLHLLTAANQNVNGTVAGNIVVKGWL